MTLLKSSNRLIQSLLVTVTDDVDGKARKKRGLNFLTGTILRLMAVQFNYRPSLRRYMKGIEYFLRFSQAGIMKGFWISLPVWGRLERGSRIRTRRN